MNGAEIQQSMHNILNRERGFIRIHSETFGGLIHGSNLSKRIK